MRRQKLSNSDAAVSILVEYLVLAGILVLFLMFISIQLNDLLERTPILITMENQFQDVGNQIAVKLTDIALIAPENGKVKAKVYMPYTVGKYDFKVEFTQVNGDYVLKISSDKIGKEVFVPINNIALEVIPVGSTFSILPAHEIVYTKYSHVKPTAVALAYPTVVYVGENVTFDMTMSFGEGRLWFKWEFGDGIDSGVMEYNPDNPQAALVKHAYSSPGNYTAKLTVWDSYGFSDSSTINITVLDPALELNPYLYVDKFVIPEVTERGKPVKIVIYLRGGGIVEQARNISVVHVIDVSGSMDPDYYGLNGYTLYKSSSGIVTPIKWDGDIYVDSTFSTLIVRAYTSGGNDIDLWVKSPDGDFARAQYSITNGELYYVRNPVEGNWSIAVVADYPLGSDTVTVEIEKNGRIYGWWYLPGEIVATYTFGLTAISENVSFSIPQVEHLMIQVTPVNGSKELHYWVREPDGSLVGPFSTSAGEYYEVRNAFGNYVVYVVADFPYGSQEYTISVDIGKIDAAKITAKTFNGFLRMSDQVGVVSFGGDGSDGSIPRITLDQYLTNNTDLANSSIDNLWAYGGTPLGGGIKVAREELVANTIPGNIPVLIILSDGNPTITSDGVVSERLAIQEALNEAEITKQTTINNESILIYTIGFGPDANETLLKQIATSPNYYYYAATAEDLANIYEQIAKELKEKAAVNVTVTDVLTQYVSLIEQPQNANVSYVNNQTIIQWSLSSIRINETWIGSFYVVPTREGEITTNVYGVSNVTYLPWPFTGVTEQTIYFPVPRINVTTLSPEKVVLK